MVASTRMFIHHLRNTMTQSYLQIIIICLCLSTVLGMPYLDASNEYEKIYPDRFLSNFEDVDSPEDIDSILAEYQRPPYPFQALERILAERYDDDEDAIADGDDSYDDNIDNGSNDDKLVGSRAKRLGFSYFPFRYTRQYILNQRNHVLPEILRAAHELREEYPPVKRRLAFTALRG